MGLVRRSEALAEALGSVRKALENCSVETAEAELKRAELLI